MTPSACVCMLSFSRAHVDSQDCVGAAVGAAVDDVVAVVAIVNDGIVVGCFLLAADKAPVPVPVPAVSGPLPGAAGARTHMGTPSVPSEGGDAGEAASNDAPPVHHAHTDSQKLEDIPLDDEPAVAVAASEGVAGSSPEKKARGGRRLQKGGGWGEQAGESVVACCGVAPLL